ncbi:hypothetical protein OG21DRAFT_317098 [Imleria badia]|nr:hypothetical protein OG21DRAFT_317098 [Imleria badia]
MLISCLQNLLTACILLVGSHPGSEYSSSPCLHHCLADRLMGLFYPLQDNEALARTNNAYDTFQAHHAAVQRNYSNLQSALDAEQRAVLKANKTISNLELALKTSREDAETLLAKNRAETETLKAAHDSKAARLHRDKSDLQYRRFQTVDARAPLARIHSYPFSTRRLPQVTSITCFLTTLS